MSAYLTAVLADAPTHYWRCADPGGNLLHSIGSAGDIMMNTNGATPVPGYSGPISDGGSGWFASNQGAWHHSGNSFSSPSSLECWVFRLANDGIEEIDFSIRDSVGIAASNKAEFAYLAGNLVDTTVLSEMTWHHLVGTYGPVGGAKLYVDTVLVASAAYAGAWGPANQIESIGMYSNATLFARSNIAECARYASELSAARVTAHFNAADNKTAPPVYGGAQIAALSSGAGSSSTDFTSLTSTILADLFSHYKNSP